MQLKLTKFIEHLCRDGTQHSHSHPGRGFLQDILSYLGNVFTGLRGLIAIQHPASHSILDIHSQIPVVPLDSIRYLASSLPLSTNPQTVPPILPLQKVTRINPSKALGNNNPRPKPRLIDILAALLPRLDKRSLHFIRNRLIDPNRFNLRELSEIGLQRFCILGRQHRLFP
jgi:hypothetical protein